MTFGSLLDAKQVAKDHKSRCSGCLSNPPTSSISSVMEPQKWYALRFDKNEFYQIAFYHWLLRFPEYFLFKKIRTQLVR